jgi:branched-chain amino acid transport system substrate-binding protein
MSKKNWQILGISLVLCVVLVIPALGGCAKRAAPEAAKGEVIIGITDDFSGPMAGVYGPRKDGEVDAIRYINEDKGGIVGHQIRAIVVDNKMDSALMTAGWERFKNEKAVAVFSGLGALPPISDPAQRDQLPVFCGQGGTVELLFPKEAGYVFSQGASLPGTIWSGYRQMERDWNVKGGKGKPKVGTDVVTIGMQKAMSEKSAKMDMEKRGWPYVITYTSIAPADVTTQVLQMKNFGCDYLFSISTEAGLVAWLKELDRQNFRPVIYGVTNLGTEEIWNATGKLCVGSRPAMNGPQWHETNLPLVSLLHQLNEKWHPEVTKRSAHYINGFAVAIVGVEGLKRAELPRLVTITSTESLCNKPLIQLAISTLE